MNVQPTKPFAWSYSKLKNYETCPRRFYETEIKKSVAEQRSQELDRGDALHEAMYNRVVGATPLPPEFIYMEKWAKKLQSPIRGQAGIIQGELKLSIDRNGTPTGYFEKGTWLRGKIDYFRILPVNEDYDIGHVVDYKTGKPPKIWDGTQLSICAYLIFCHYKTVRKLRVDYLWTEWADTTHENYERKNMAQLIADVTPRVETMQGSCERGEFNPRPCGLCENYCPVTACEYNGEPYRRRNG